MKKNIRQLNFTDERDNLEERLLEIQQNRHPIALLLGNVIDVRNIGSIFRLADAANLEKIYLYGEELDLRHKKVERTSRSTVQYVPFEQLQTLDAVQALKERYQIVGLEITNESMVYTEFSPQKPILLVIGSERTGISEELLQVTDACIHLPMYGVNTSMNVLCATGIAVYHLLTKVE